MTLHYTLVFGMLAVEAVLFAILVLPVPRVWRRKALLFVRRSKVISQVLYWVRVTFVFVAVLFVDAVLRMNKVSQEKEAGVMDMHNEYLYNSKKFYAQRNVYLTGFTLFLSLALSRTVAILLDSLSYEPELQTSKKKMAYQDVNVAGLEEENAKLIKRLAELEKELAASKKKVIDFEALKKQAKGLNDEYARLSDRYTELEKKSQRTSSEPRKDM